MRPAIGTGYAQFQKRQGIKARRFYCRSIASVFIFLIGVFICYIFLGVML